MLYCPKCQLLCLDSEACPSCGTKKLREPEPDDPVLLLTADEIKTEMIEAVFEENNQLYEERVCGLGGPPSVVFGKNANTNYNIFVPFGELESAQTLLHGIGILDTSDKPEDTVMTEEEEDTETEEPEELSSGKRTIFRILSVILFILAVWGVVAVSDYAANALKAFFSSIK